ncbi:MAG: hypothetical protein VX341_00690 [Bdellovibrionota bacterium]|nr:hypothetical protein [Bdellovibrionota bacterium]
MKKYLSIHLVHFILALNFGLNLDSPLLSGGLKFLKFMKKDKLQIQSIVIANHKSALTL